MAEYVLHCFAQSGNAYKPALALSSPGPTGRRASSTISTARRARPAYRAINVMGEVPMLEHRGAVLCQSGVILDYLAETLGRFASGQRRRAPRDPALALLGQPQADELHGHVSLHARPSSRIRSPRCWTSFAAARRPRGACSKRISTRRKYVVARAADDRRSLARRLPLLRRRDRRRLERVSRDPRLARQDQERAALGAPLRADAGASAA